MNKRKTFGLSLITALVFSVLLSVSGFDASCNQIEREILRLHILANSDSEADQSLKLMVRDEILELQDELFGTATSKEEAINLTRHNMDKIISVAEDVVRENGYDYSVNAEITESYFNTRVYENFTLPAGNYDALKITIGKGGGKNWWCVLFPEICLGSASDFSNTLSDKTQEIITEPQNYEVKFKVVELYCGMREKINSIFSK